MIRLSLISPQARRWLAVCLAPWALLLAFLATGATAQDAPAPAAPPLAIEAITGALHPGSEVVRIALSRPLQSVPTSFAVQSPARIALDLPGAVNALGRQVVDIQQGSVRSVQVVQSGERTRLVINLKTPVPYTLQVEGRSLLVVMTPTAAPAAAAAIPAAFAESRNRDALPLKDLDFRRGPDNAGRVIVDLASSQVGVDIRQQGQNLVVEFLKSSLPEGLRRRLDVADFATPVQTITAQQAGDRVRLVI